ncbi:AAA family ATPase [Aestuariicoccus sp. MJ-SS9]|uniref:bifunctional aminoglycoside phosphotransferase/ATP-binding protein n=1 Tax=Aestuariicoccus sp. MJ-SS9 TaxID=3079855 RepID=UPI002910B08E|nr:AAA family ATPase [Aestuariicoccus sp. MJ-SS9]MDU8911605.1 AAA family ATPase [Aestuariicoccus sp. MJ-SS9]
MQEPVIAFLSDPQSHGIAGPVEVIQTHSAIVFLAGGHAYKIKRAVKYDYLDFLSLAAREAVLRRELALNKPAAPTIYDRVVPITRDSSGALALDGPGDPVEYVLVMRRFPAKDELANIAEAGGLTIPIADALGRSVAGYHAAAEVLRTGEGAVLIHEIIEELERVFAGMTDTLGADPVAHFSMAARAQLQRHRALLDRRSGEGRVRRCHGDLHLKNLVMIDGVPVPFDALEFDERLGTCDVYYDLAFLIMDLWHRGLRVQANAMLSAYVSVTGDISGLAALPLFLGIRSAIRAMVDVQTWRLTGDATLTRNALTYLTDANAFLDPPPPRLVAIGGLSGTGKTTVARLIAPGIGPPPGALVLRSDVERKALFGAAPLEPLPPSAYSEAASRRTYVRLFARAAEALAAGHGALLDATFLDAQDRAAAARVAARAGVPFQPVWLTAPPDILARRIRTRAADASDATEAVLRAQIASAKAPGDWPRADASGDPETSAAAARTCLDAQEGAGQPPDDPQLSG